MKQAVSTRQHGSALLEALIAILIFSIGILALVGMQAASIKNSSDAKYRADAAYLASQIIGQIWVDRANIAAYAHRDGGAACAPTGTDSNNANVNAWLAQTAALLPGADSTKQQIIIGAVTATNAYPVTVTVCWQGPQDASSHNFVARAEINTLP